MATLVKQGNGTMSNSITDKKPQRKRVSLKTTYKKCCIKVIPKSRKETCIGSSTILGQGSMLLLQIYPLVKIQDLVTYSRITSPRNPEKIGGIEPLKIPPMYFEHLSV